MSLLSSPTPKGIVSVLDTFVIGQHEAKKSVAIALRNRARRQALEGYLKDEIMPKNIIMMGPTGVGKTEIARRLSKLASAPFVKVEATKYTEVGYVGRDVESIIRDLATISVELVKKELRKIMKPKASKMVEEAILDIMLPKRAEASKGKEKKEGAKTTREKMRDRLKSGAFEDKTIKISIENSKSPMVEIFSNASIEEIDANIQNLFSNITQAKVKERKLTVREARELLIEREYDKLIDIDKLAFEAIKRVEEMGIVFLDEIDKIINGSKGSNGPDISREGVQRDLLPLIEGCVVNTRFGMIKTDHILFIAAGAFHSSKPSDLIPELQGRFPIRVALKPLVEADFYAILTEPANSLIKQYIALLETEGIKLKFNKDAIKQIAHIAYLVNKKTEDIGARRLHTVMEKLIEEISFNASELTKKNITITKEYVNEKLLSIVKDKDISQYIL